MASLREPFDEQKKVLQQYCCNQDWVNMECFCFLRNVEDLLADGKTLYERRYGEPFKGPIIPFGAMVEYHPISARGLSRIHQFGKKVSPGIFLGFELIAGRFWEGDIRIADFRRFGKSWRIRNLSSKNQPERSIWQHKKDDDFIFPVADGTAKLSGRDYELREPTPKREPTVRSEHFSRELQSESGESQPTESTDDVEVCADFRWIQGDFIYRHHNEPRFQLYVPKEETLPIPLKYIDETRSTHADLEVMQEKRVDDWWNVDHTETC